MTLNTEAHTMSDLEMAVKTLANIEPTSSLVLSAYLPLDAPQARLQEAVCRILEIQRSMGRHLRDEALDLIKGLESHLADLGRQPGKGLACFIRRGHEPMDLVVPLPGQLSLEVGLDALPSIFRLVEMKDVYHRYAVVILKKDSARIFEVHAGNITRNMMLVSLDLRTRLSKEISRESYVNHQKERGTRFFREKVAILDNILRENGMDHLILVGEPRTSSVFRDLLPPHLQDKLIEESVDGNLNSFEDILRSTLEAFAQEEERESCDNLERLRHSMATGGLAISGYRSVREALRDHRVDQLIVSKEAPSALAEPIVCEAVSQGIDIETVEDNDFMEDHEGFGAFVRYRLHHP